MPAEIIVLPAGVPDARPQMLLNADGMWRDVTPRAGDAFSAEDFRNRVEKVLSTAMQQVSIGKVVNPMSFGFANNTFGPLYEELMPIEVRDAIDVVVNHEPQPALKIYLHPGAEWIPWEILHDGTGYLGLRMRVVRLPIMSQPAGIPDSKQRKVSTVYNLLGRDVLSPKIAKEWEHTFDPFNNGNGWETRCPNGGGPFASLDELKSAEDANIIHVTCHGGLRDDPKSAYYWSLDHSSQLFFNYRISAQTLQKLNLRKQPLVFGNACAAALAGNASSNEGALHGFGALFMMKGALNFIGTIAPITQQTSVDFAKAFYANLLDPAGRDIAEALLETKKNFVGVKTEDPSYLFYSLYGPPDILYKAVH